MDYFLISYYYSLPYLMAIGAALALLTVATFSLRWPMLPVLAYLAVFCNFAGSTYGTVSGSASTIYSRGTGQLFFPFVIWGLALSVFWMTVSARLGRLRRVEPESITRWFWLWFWLLVVHICVGLVVNVDIERIVDSEGFINIIWMGLLVALLVVSAQGKQSVRVLASFLVLAAFLRSGFGLVRWAALGGDPANVYNNVEKVAVKLTFFDISDSLLCVVGGAVCASQLLLQRDESASRGWRAFQWLVLLMCIACVLLSFRRSAWIGLLLAGVWLFYRFRPTLRLVGIAVVLPVLTAAITYLFLQRLGRQVGSHGVWAFFYDLLGSQQGQETGRSLELRMATNAFLGSPVFGLGAWGSYGATTLIPWQNPFHPGGFMHSGLLHVLMKTGLVGLLLFVGTIGSFIRGIRRCTERSSADAALIFASVAGLYFLIPDFLIGTPLIEMRQTQLIGMCLALPFFVLRAQKLDAMA